jgi:pentatricopeptide repeat protein
MCVPVLSGGRIISFDQMAPLSKASFSTSVERYASSMSMRWLCLSSCDIYHVRCLKPLLGQSCKSLCRGVPLCLRLEHRAFCRAAMATADTSAILSFLNALPEEGATAQTYHHAISSARAARDAEVVQAILDLMRARGVQPDRHHWSNALAVCKATGDVERAFSWYGQMVASGVQPDAHVITALITACSEQVRRLREQRRAARAHVAGGRLQVRDTLRLIHAACLRECM